MINSKVRGVSSKARLNMTALISSLVSGLIAASIIFMFWLSGNSQWLATSLENKPTQIIVIIGIFLTSLIMLATYLAQLARLNSQNYRAYAVRLEDVLEHLPGAAFRGGPEDPWPIDYISEGCLALFGYHRKEFESHKIKMKDLIYPEDVKVGEPILKESIANNTAFVWDCRVTCKDGSEKWILINSKYIEEGIDGKPYVQGFYADIAQRKRAELELVGQKKYTDAIKDVALEAILTGTPDGIIETSNQSACNMFGYTADEFTGMKVGQLFSPKHTAEHERDLENYRRTGQYHKTDKELEVEFIRRDGSLFPAMMNHSAIEYKSATKIVMDIRDISVQRAAEKDAFVAREHLAHTDRLSTVGEMATSLAHEINQPLAAISLFSQAGKRFLTTGDHDKLPDIFDKLSLHSQRAGDIISRVQSMASQSHGQRDFVDCNQLMRDVKNLAQAEATFHDVDICLLLEDQHPKVRVDTVQIQQVTLNLIRNGIQAMNQIDFVNGREILVKVCSLETGNVAITVTDSGTGISFDRAADVFIPFSSTKKTGMGVGLWISQNIIKSHAGKLSFENNPGSGASFTFELPIAKERAEHEQ